MESCVTEFALDASSDAMAWVKPNLKRKPETYTVATEDAPATFGGMATRLSEWLDTNVDQPAEPFDSWAADEVIDADPIIRPGSEKDISGERGQ